MNTGYHKNIKQSRLLKNENGYTLIELGIAMFIASLLVIFLGTSVVASRKYFLTGYELNELQRDYAMLIELLANTIRMGNSDDSGRIAECRVCI